MSDTRGDDGERDVQERGWFLDWGEDEKLDGEIMNAFEYIGLTLMALGIGLLIVMGVVYIFSNFVE